MGSCVTSKQACRSHLSYTHPRLPPSFLLAHASLHLSMPADPSVCVSLRVGVAIVFLSYPLTCNVTSKFFVCNVPGNDGSWVLNADVSIVCYSDTWWVTCMLMPNVKCLMQPLIHPLSSQVDLVWARYILHGGLLFWGATLLLRCPAKEQAPPLPSPMP